MNKDYEIISHRRRELLQTILTGAVILIVATAGTYLGMDLVYANRVLPGVQFLNIDLGGKKEEEVKDLLQTHINSAQISMLRLEFDERIWDLDPNEFEFKVDADVLAEKALQIGRRGSLIQRLQERFLVIARAKQAVVSGSELVRSFNQEKLNQYLAMVSEQINQPRQNAELIVKKDRATKFVPSQDGYELDVDQTILLIAQNIFNSSQLINLPVKVSPADVELEQTNTWGIDTLISRGVSDFSGSPKNRRHNIAVGAARFDGVLIAPDQTFSFLRVLGEVDASTGYLPELVIKEDKTIPEFGGGLCQVSTTAFRAILNGGLPVLARQNHSYRVVYYEPAGTDATVYQPHPDLQFKNDTPGYILVDTYIEGSKLYFDFYGTDTRREVEIDGPRIFNITDYPEPIYIDTSTLPPGEIKQIDSTHRGADTVVYRKVYEDGKLIRTDSFRSHYVPWPAKYLRGVEEAAKVETDLENIPPKDTSSEKALVDPLNPPQGET